MATAPPEIDEIRRRMAQIRRELHADVQGVVEGAEAATDWRRYVRSYPWATLGVALAVGYLVVPRRHKHSTTTVHVAPAEAIQAVRDEVAALRPAEPEKPKKKGKGIVGTLFGLVAPVALRAAQGYALQFFEQFMAQKMAQQLQNHPDLAAAFGGPAPSPFGGPGPGPQGPPPGRAPGTPRF